MCWNVVKNSEQVSWGTSVLLCFITCNYIIYCKSESLGLHLLLPLNNGERHKCLNTRIVVGNVFQTETQKMHLFTVVQCCGLFVNVLLKLMFFTLTLNILNINELFDQSGRKICFFLVPGLSPSTHFDSHSQPETLCQLQKPLKGNN